MAQDPIFRIPGLREGICKYYIWNEYTSQLLVNYNKSFQKTHDGALFGFEQWEQNYKYTEATRKGGGSDELNRVIEYHWTNHLKPTLMVAQN